MDHPVCQLMSKQPCIKDLAAGKMCPSRSSSPNYEDESEEDSRNNHIDLADLKGCRVREEQISTIPNVTDDVLYVLKDSTIGSPGFICADVHFTIQPKVGSDSVASLIVIDYECPGCFFDLGPNGSVNISFFIASDRTVSPPELTFKFDDPPGVSRPRDTKLKTFESRKWKDIGQSPALNYSLDIPVAQFRGCEHKKTYNKTYNKTYDPIKSCTLHCGSVANCTAIPPVIPPTYVSTQIVIDKILSEFQAGLEEQQSRFVCEYEDPIAPGQIGHPWQGIVRPRCEREYLARLRFLNNILFNDYTPYGQGSPRKDPVTLGVRLHARVMPGHAGFKIGYRFAQSDEICRAGAFSQTGTGPCDRCPAGKFATVDAKSGSCFECPKGTYSNGTGAIQCSACPLGKSTGDRGSNSSQDCRYFCAAGKFSTKGLEPCKECPKNTTQSRVGATYCDPCFKGGVTTGKGTGFTNVYPWICMDATNLQFVIEEVKLFGQQVTVRVLWDIPAQHLDVEDIVAVFKGDPHESIRQLQWMYASAADTTCIGWVDDLKCREKGTNVVPRGSANFEFDSAGPGLYSAVFYSERQQLRILTDTYICKRASEVSGRVSAYNFACPPDMGGWEALTGLRVCGKGMYSKSNGGLPCYDCEPGTVTDLFGSTKCTECEQGFYSNELCVEGKPCADELKGLAAREKCFQCPTGKSTLQSKSVERDCDSCESLLKKTNQEIPFCARSHSNNITDNVTMPVATTPEPDYCGNGILQKQETCDDGNDAVGDGCSLQCTIEAGYRCIEEV